MFGGPGYNGSSAISAIAAARHQVSQVHQCRVGASCGECQAGASLGIRYSSSLDPEGMYVGVPLNYVSVPSVLIRFMVTHSCCWQFRTGARDSERLPCAENNTLVSP